MLVFSARAVFTRALMKKGLRQVIQPQRRIENGFHACPDEEGITTLGGGQRYGEAVSFHACPDEEGITTAPPGFRCRRHCVFTRALMKKGLRRSGPIIALHINPFSR